MFLLQVITDIYLFFYCNNISPEAVDRSLFHDTWILCTGQVITKLLKIVTYQMFYSKCSIELEVNSVINSDAAICMNLMSCALGLVPLVRF